MNIFKHGWARYFVMAAGLAIFSPLKADGPFFPPDPYEEPDPCDGNDGPGVPGNRSLADIPNPPANAVCS
jgi:hypothetical protein